MRDYCFQELAAEDARLERRRLMEKNRLALGNFVRTGLNEFGTVVDFVPLNGLVTLKDWQGETFHAVEGLCSVVGETI